MCGIFGGYRAYADLDKIKDTCRALEHRGPDSFFYHQGESSFLGGVRLAIVGGDRVSQPFVSNDGLVQVVANGEVYNWQELRDELLAKGYYFKTSCDLEVLPSAWQEWGEGMFAKLNGMFSIAIMDRGDLILARDPCGQKPLYIAERGESFYFASEIRAFRELGIPLGFDKKWVGHYLALRYVPEPNTLFRDIRILPAGHYLRVKPSGEEEMKRWWTAPVFSNESSTLSENLGISQLGEHVDEAVRLACPLDQASVLYLSSGIDSALLLDAAVKQGADLCAITASFGAGSDEGAAAERLAGSYGVEHHHVRLDSSVFSHLERVVGQMEVPVGDSIILAFDALAAATSELGARVALGGEGPDELFQGYSFQKLLYYAEKSPRALRQLVGAGMKCAPVSFLDKLSGFPASLGQSGKNKVAEWALAYHQLSDWQKGVGLKTLFSSDEIGALLGGGDWREPELSFPEGVVEAHHLQQFNEWLPDWSIIRQERNTMAHSVEYRMPFLDKSLMDYSGCLPRSFKIRSGKTKWIWRELAKSRLGHRVGGISKKPFYMPVEQFAQSREFKEMLGDLLAYDRVKQRGVFCPDTVRGVVDKLDRGDFLSVKKVMSLIIFEIWSKQFEI